MPQPSIVIIPFAAIVHPGASGEQETAPTPPPASAPPADATSTAIAERPAAAPSKPALDQLPPFRVILHNDDVNEVGYVIATITQLTSLPKTRAIAATFEAHDKGLTLLLVTHKERAELYQEQFHSKQLTVTIEPAE